MGACQRGTLDDTNYPYPPPKKEAEQADDEEQEG